MKTGLAVQYPAGPLLVPSSALPPELRSGQGVTDIGDKRGKLMPVSMKLAYQLLGVAKPNIAQLVELGMIEQFEHPHGQLKFVLLDPCMTNLDHYDAWVKTLEPNLSLEALARHKKVRQLLAIPPTHPCGAVLSSVAAHLSQIGNFSMAEVAGLIPISHEAKPAILSALRKLRGSSRIYSAMPGLPGDPVAIARAMVPDEWQDLPQTCLASTSRRHYAAVPAEVLARIDALKTFRRAALLYFLHWWPKTRSPGVRISDVLIFERMELVLGHRPPDDPDIAGLKRYIDFGDAIWHDTKSTRLRTVLLWLTICRRLARLSSVAGTNGHLPAMPAFLPAERDAIFKARHSESAAGAALRKVDAHAVLKALPDLFAVCHNRREQVRRCGEAVRAAIQVIEPNEPFADILVSLPELCPLGLDTGRVMELPLRVWRTADAWASLEWESDDLAAHNDVDLQLRLKAARSRARKGKTGSTPFIVEALEGCSSRLPWFVDMAKMFASDTPAKLPQHIRIQRFDYLVRWGLPGYSSTPAGLLTFDSNRLSLARNAAITGRVFAPVEEFEHAIRFAALIFEIALFSMRRLGEITQLQLNRLTEVDDRPCFTQKVWPKLSRYQPLTTSSCALDIHASMAQEAYDLAELTKQRLKVDELPESEPAHALAWKLGRAKYVFAFRGRMFESGLVCNFLRYLFAGWPVVTAHLLRHAAAGEANDDDEPLSVIQASLDHDSPLSTPRYAALPPEWQLAKDVESDLRRMQRLDHLALQQDRIHAGY